MSLFEPDNDQPGHASNEDDGKIRLFETQERESRGVHDHLKRFLPVALVAVLLVAGGIYFMQPGIGDAVKPPIEVEHAVYDYLLSREKRSVREITFYKCDGYFWVKVLAEPRSSLASIDDPANQYRLRVGPVEEKPLKIQTLPLPEKPDDVPCKN